MKITEDHVEMWCNADRRKAMLRERPEAEAYCPTVAEVLDARAKEGAA